MMGVTKEGKRGGDELLVSISFHFKGFLLLFVSKLVFKLFWDFAVDPMAIITPDGVAND